MSRVSMKVSLFSIFILNRKLQILLEIRTGLRFELKAWFLGDQENMASKFETKNG